MVQIVSEQVSHDGTPLVSRTHSRFVDTEQSPSKHSLVLLHGWGLNSGVWDSVLPLLVENFNLVTVDIPGFGLNANHVPEPYTLESIADWVLPCIPEGAIVLGWSMGGLIAQSIAISQPKRLKALITIASTPCFVERQDWHGIKPTVLAMFEQQLETDFSRTLKRFLAIQAMGSPSAKHDIKNIQSSIQTYPEPSPVALLDGLGLLSSVDMRAEIHRIQSPTLRLYGRLDSLVPQDGIDAIQALQQDCKTVVVPHAAHAPFISHPQIFACAVTEFAQSI